MKLPLILSVLFSLPLSASIPPSSPGNLKSSKLPPAFLELYSGGSTREAELPGFETESEALGYEPGETFTVPRELKNRVVFWKKIYSEYSTSQGVLHDSDHPEIVYEVVDLNPTDSDITLSYQEQMKRFRAVFNEEEKRIEATLRLCHERRDRPERLTKDAREVFKRFENLHGKNKFLDAIDRIRLQVGQRDRIVQGYFFGGRYMKRMMHIFAQHHLPLELTRLPLVESAFNLEARSKVGASGIWQFMRSTGSHFLHIDRHVDERNDPIAATHAAADLLRANYEALGSWPLAITAWNHGRAGMMNAVRSVDSKDIDEIIRNYHGRSFGFASANFYAEFLAILELERDYRKHFGELMTDDPIESAEFPVSDDIRFGNLAGACHVERTTLARLNPALTEWVVSGQGFVPSGFRLRIPPDHVSKCRRGYQVARKFKAERVKLARGRTHSHKHQRTKKA